MKAKIRKLLCWLGLHKWEERIGYCACKGCGWYDDSGLIVCKTCDYCKFCHYCSKPKKKVGGK